jgi:hypothetical protein
MPERNNCPLVAWPIKVFIKKELILLLAFMVDSA